jgi:hypothetical protein
VIVEAKPHHKSEACEQNNANCNYWIRTRIATGCGTVAQDDETTGIIRYNATATAVPTSIPNDDRTLCEDEPVEKLRPVFKWDIEKLQNDRENFTFDADIEANNPLPYLPNTSPALRWDLTETPLFLDYGNPSILNTHNNTYFESNFTATVNYSNPHWKDGYVYLVITGRNLTAAKRPIPAAHPIHLHGHDFVILAQENSEWDGITIPKNHRWNPPRRDVALLYSGGYLALAFKLDNPGIWLVHW